MDGNFPIRCGNSKSWQRRCGKPDVQAFERSQVFLEGGIEQRDMLDRDGIRALLPEDRGLALAALRALCVPVNNRLQGFRVGVGQALLVIIVVLGIHPHDHLYRIQRFIQQIAVIPDVELVHAYRFRVVLKHRHGTLISALLFTLPHLFNREVWVEGGTWALIHYFLWGFLAAFSSILTEGFEMAVAMHLSNNLVVSIVANYKGSSLSSVSFYLLENETSSPKAIMAFVLLFAFELFLFYILKKRGQK